MTELIEAARLSSLADDTPEGRSVVDLAAEKGVRGPESGGARPRPGDSSPWSNSAPAHA